MTTTRHLHRRNLTVAVLVVLAAALVLLLNAPRGSAATPATGSKTAGSSLTAAVSSSKVKPTIVLVHGAFADASGWSGAISRLQKLGYPVIAPANPLRSLPGDSEYLRSFLTTIPGPVVLVGHSYGGAVITNAATGNPNVKALVYIAAYIPKQGETLGAAGELGGGTSMLPPNLVVRPYPGAGPTDGDGSINPAAFRAVFAADVAKKLTNVMAATQRPIALSTLGTPSGVPAWKTVPSWALLATEDRAIPVQAERVMAKRANSTTVEIHSSHAAMVSHPGVVTKLIVAAATAR